jgi:hypothetical protein
MDLQIPAANRFGFFGITGNKQRFTGRMPSRIVPERWRGVGVR